MGVFRVPYFFNLRSCWIFAKFEDYLLDIFRIRKLSLILHLFSTYILFWNTVI